MVLPFPELPDPAAALSLRDTGLIRARGADARSFLQSQLSNDAKLVSASKGQLSGYCSPKGRLLAVFTVVDLGDDAFGLVLPLALVASTLKRLKLFVLRSKLVLSDASAELPALGLIGPGSAKALVDLGLPVPEQDYATACIDGIHLLRRPGPALRFELRAAPERLAALQSRLDLPTANAGLWELTDVLAGTPQVVAETVDHFVPQSIDLDSRGGVSFTKGCYPGQEIVARVHYLGRIKQRLRLGTAEAAAAPGTAVLDAAGNSVGEVMAAAAHPALGAVLALSLNLSHPGGAPLHVDGQSAPITPEAAA